MLLVSYINFELRMNYKIVNNSGKAVHLQNVGLIIPAKGSLEISSAMHARINETTDADNCLQIVPILMEQGEEQQDMQEAKRPAKPKKPRVAKKKPTKGSKKV